MLIIVLSYWSLIMRRNFRKIDIFTKSKGVLNQWQYEGSSNWSKSCKDAKSSYCEQYSLDPSQVKACFRQE
jgi:hypothetical protein